MGMIIRISLPVILLSYDNKLIHESIQSWLIHERVYLPISLVFRALLTNWRALFEFERQLVLALFATDQTFAT